MQKFILWVRYNSDKNGRRYEKHIKLNASDMYAARVKAEKYLSKISGDITAEQLYFA